MFANPYRSRSKLHETTKLFEIINCSLEDDFTEIFCSLEATGLVEPRDAFIFLRGTLGPVLFIPCVVHLEPSPLTHSFFCENVLK